MGLKTRARNSSPGVKAIPGKGDTGLLCGFFEGYSPQMNADQEFVLRA